MERIYVNNTCTLQRCDSYLLTLTLPDGQVLERLEPHLLFPVTSATTYISLLDEKEAEVALIRDLADLDATSRAEVEACFATFYRIPIIKKLLNITEKYGTLTWSVETDRGPLTFYIRNRYSTVKRIGKRFRVRDISDNRYEIPDYTAMDPHSRRLLIPYM